MPTSTNTLALLHLRVKTAIIGEVRALVVKGLSRLPVTEEIAGSNPVERAIKSRYPLGWRFFII